MAQVDRFTYQKKSGKIFLLALFLLILVLLESGYLDTYLGAVLFSNEEKHFALRGGNVTSMERKDTQPLGPHFILNQNEATGNNLVGTSEATVETRVNGLVQNEIDIGTAQNVADSKHVQNEIKVGNEQNAGDEPTIGVAGQIITEQTNLVTPDLTNQMTDNRINIEAAVGDATNNVIDSNMGDAPQNRDGELNQDINDRVAVVGSGTYNQNSSVNTDRQIMSVGETSRGSDGKASQSIEVGVSGTDIQDTNKPVATEGQLAVGNNMNVGESGKQNTHDTAQGNDEIPIESEKGAEVPTELIHFPGMDEKVLGEVANDTQSNKRVPGEKNITLEEVDGKKRAETKVKDNKMEENPSEKAEGPEEK